MSRAAGLAARARAMPGLIVLAVLIVLFALAAVVWLAGACRDSRPAVTSCSDTLSGVWRGQGTTPGGEPWRFQVVDRAGPAGHSIEVFPMFDDSIPPDGDKRASAIEYSPAVFDLERHGTAVVGKRTYRARRGGTICTVSHQAAIRACQKNSLRLAWVETSAIDWTSCSALSASRWTTIELARE